MIITIDKNHSIFQSQQYQKDIIPFQLLELIKEFPILLVSDENSFVIGASHPDMPVWIWTADNISDEAKTELAEYFYNQFKERGKLKFVAKPIIAEMLSQPFIQNNKARKTVINMQSFENRKVIPAKNQNVIIENPTENDINGIAICLCNFDKECFGEENKSPTNYITIAEKLLNNQYCFVIKDEDKVVAMAQSTRETDRYIAVSRVYTMPEYRKKGYASAIVAHISKLILDNGKIPTLYTDLSNPSSNTAYKNVGFVEQSPVDEVTLEWEN